MPARFPAPDGPGDDGEIDLRGSRVDPPPRWPTDVDVNGRGARGTVWPEHTVWADIMPPPP